MTPRETVRLDSTTTPEHLRRASHSLLAATLPLLRLNPVSTALAQEVWRRYPEHRAQLSAGACLLGVDPPDLTLATLSYDLLLGMYGCSTAALATRDGPVVARNMDWAPPDLIARASCVVPTSGGTSAGFAGGVGVVTGLSRRGFAVVLNAVGCDRLNPAGYPVLLFLRHLLDQARDYQDALARATRMPLVSSALITLVGRRNSERAVVERRPLDARVRTALADEPLVTTNHYQLLDEGGWCERQQSLTTCTRLLPDRPSAEQLLACLTRPPVLNDITAQHIIAHPAAQTLRMWVPEALCLV